ncbi:GEVED domain-containing protein [Flavobacterium microcysteis]
MKKTTLLSGVRQNFTQIKSLFFGTFLLVSATAQSQTYCTPEEGDCSDGDQIVNVTFAGINNNSGCGALGYNDFTNGSAAAVIVGQSYTLSVTIPEHFGVQQAAVWFDFNDDGIFDASEFTNLGSSPAAGSVLTATIAIPATATIGNTRMRVKAQYSQAIAATSSCDEPYLGFGEYEDYSVNIISATPCTGTPAVGAASSTQASVCGLTSFVLSASGVTPTAGFSYQWQSSPTGTDQWTNLGAAQASLNYTRTGQTEATFYRVVITCSGSGLSANSTAISVGQNAVEACYCSNAINMNCTDGDVITNVTIGSINNTTTCGNSTTGYTNYSGSVTPPVFNAGATIPVSVSVGPSGEGWLFESVGVWIDYNKNGIFDEAEYTYVGTGLNEALSANIEIPTTAVVGNTRMRVLVAASAATSFGHQFACGPVVADNNYGEIEDYTITIAPPLSTPGFENSSVSVYPNPTNGLVNIQFANQTTVDAINVYSVSGQLVYSKQFSSASDSYTIDLQKAATGVYIMKLEGENGTIVKRLIKN